MLAWFLARGLHVILIFGICSAVYLDQLADAVGIELGLEDMDAIEVILPVGFVYGERYDVVQAISFEGYC